MEREMESGQEQEHEGEKYLRLVGLEHLADQPMGRKDSTTIPARDFLDVCGDDARQLLVGLENTSPDDPDFAPTREAIRGYIQQHIIPAEN